MKMKEVKGLEIKDLVEKLKASEANLNQRIRHRLRQHVVILHV